MLIGPESPENRRCGDQFSRTTSQLQLADPERQTADYMQRSESWFGLLTTYSETILLAQEEPSVVGPCCTAQSFTSPQNPDQTSRHSENASGISRSLPGPNSQLNSTPQEQIDACERSNSRTAFRRCVYMTTVWHKPGKISRSP